jgi:hypothetical protein
MLKSDLEVWRRRASAAESKPPEIHNLPDFLAEICQNTTLQGAEKHARHWSDSALSIAFVFYATSAKAYRFAKAFFALPSISLIYQRMGATIHFHEENILQLEMIPRAVARWRAQWEIDPNLIVHAILAGDAAVFTPEVVANYPYHRPSNNVHLFMVLPLNPTFRSFVVHILPHPTGSLGQAGQDCYQKIAASLSESGVQIISFASDGDRGHCPYQMALLAHYEALLWGGDDIVTCCATVFERDAPRIPIWWIADCLHALKCQRCRLANNLTLTAMMPVINAASVNAILHLRQSLTNLTGAAKMSDIFAVQVFSLENLSQLFRSGCIAAGYYLAPFVMWYASISISSLHPSLRLDLLSISFTVFRDWFIRMNRGTRIPPNSKFFTEKIDLVRYLNTILFLHQAIETFPEIALNRIGTHPVENIFGLMRVASNGNHSWDRCKGVLTKVSLMNEILCAHNVKSHVRRDFAIAGVKVLETSEQELLQIHGFGDRGITCTQWISMVSDDPTSAQLPGCFAQWLHDLEVLTEWKRATHPMKLYTPRPGASDAQLSRIISFAFGETPGTFKWTKRRKQQAIQWHDNPEFSVELIASRLGCTPEDVETMLQRLVTQEQGQ